MPPRMVITGGRTVISKPGYDAASGSLADSQKIFDSNWQVSGVVIARGLVNIPSDVTSFVIPFPPQHFIPTAEVFNMASDGTFTALAGYTTSDSIVLDVVPGYGNRVVAGPARWVVYGISQ